MKFHEFVYLRIQKGRSINLLYKKSAPTGSVGADRISVLSGNYDLFTLSLIAFEASALAFDARMLAADAAAALAAIEAALAAALSFAAALRSAACAERSALCADSLRLDSMLRKAAFILLRKLISSYRLMASFTVSARRFSIAKSIPQTVS